MSYRPASELLVIRHPETLSNLEHRYVGRGDSPFSARGERQRDELILAVGAWMPERVYTSPIERARSVAERVAGCGVPLVVSEELAEVDFGCAEGLTYDEIRERGLRVDHPGFGVEQTGTLCGESWEEFAARVSSIATVLRAETGRTAVFTHGGVVRALIAVMLDLPRDVAWRFRVENATAARITRDGEYVSLRGLGLPPAGIVP